MWSHSPDSKHLSTSPQSTLCPQPYISINTLHPVLLLCSSHMHERVCQTANKQTLPAFATDATNRTDVLIWWCASRVCYMAASQLPGSFLTASSGRTALGIPSCTADNTCRSICSQEVWDNGNKQQLICRFGHQPCLLKIVHEAKAVASNHAVWQNHTVYYSSA